MTATVVDFYERLLLIRRFEETLLDAFKTGVIHGTTHTSIGQEANAVGVISQISPGDVIVSNHRCHGHFLAYGGSPSCLFAELLGKPAGVCGGRGGSQHIHWHDFYTNGIQGGILPMAVGIALAEKIKKSNALTVVFMGDGTLGEGAVYEALNMASLWQVPIMIVLENNHIAQTTPTSLAVAGSITARFEAFGIATMRVDTSDVMQIAEATRQIVEDIRLTHQPKTLVIDTERLGAHSKGDDTRPDEIMRKIRETRDPIMIQGARLSQAERQAVDSRIEQAVRAAYQIALDGNDKEGQDE